MDNEIAPKESTVIESFPTLEEFKALCLGDTSCKSIDKLADAFDNLPTCIKLLKNLDPTGGFISYFADALSELKAKKNEEKLWKTLYELHKSLYIMNIKLLKINPEYFESHVIALTEIYFDYSMRAYQLEKIEIFRNAFICGVFDYDRTLDEKENIFSLIASLTLEQIRILKFCYKSVMINGKDSIGINEIAENLHLAESYVDQLCHNLNGKGLIVGVPPTLAFRGLRGYGSYRIKSYLEHLIKYIIEPVEISSCL